MQARFARLFCFKHRRINEHDVPLLQNDHLSPEEQKPAESKVSENRYVKACRDIRDEIDFLTSRRKKIYLKSAGLSMFSSLCLAGSATALHYRMYNSSLQVLGLVIATTLSSAALVGSLELFCIANFSCHMTLKSISKDEFDQLNQFLVQFNLAEINEMELPRTVISMLRNHSVFKDYELFKVIDDVLKNKGLNRNLSEIVADYVREAQIHEVAINIESVSEGRSLTM